MDNQQDQLPTIDLQNIDWNNLSVEEFQSLESKIALRDKQLRLGKERKKRVTNDKVGVTLRGKTYIVTQVIAARLHEMKSQKSKDKLIDQIISESNAVQEI